MRNQLLIILITGVWLLAGCGEPAQEPLPVNTRMGGEFTLVDQDAKPFESSQLAGSVVLLNFGFTSCPDVCPAVVARMTQAYKALEAQGDAAGVQPVFVTFDPARDTPAHLNKYLQWFHEDFIGLTGSDAQIAHVASLFGVIYLQDGEGDVYDFTHSDYVYLLDQQGRVRKVYPADFNIEEVVRDAASLL